MKSRLCQACYKLENLAKELDISELLVPICKMGTTKPLRAHYVDAVLSLHDLI